MYLSLPHNNHHEYRASIAPLMHPLNQPLLKPQHVHAHPQPHPHQYLTTVSKLRFVTLKGWLQSKNALDTARGLRAPVSTPMTAM